MRPSTARRARLREAWLLSGNRAFRSTAPVVPGCAGVAHPSLQRRGLAASLSGDTLGDDWPERGLEEAQESDPAQAGTGRPRRTRLRRRCLDPAALFDVIVRSFASDDHVMHMALAQTSVGDAHKTRPGLQLFDRPTTKVSHARAQSADKLVDHGFERTAMGHAAFNAFRHILCQAILTALLTRDYALGTCRFIAEILRALEISLARTLRHRAQRSHAAVRFERPALVENRLAGALIDAGEERTDHHGIRARRNGLGHIARILDASVGNNRDSELPTRAKCLADSGNLRHARSRHHARGANRSGSDAYL